MDINNDKMAMLKIGSLLIGLPVLIFVLIRLFKFLHNEQIISKNGIIVIVILFIISFISAVISYVRSSSRKKS